MQCALFWPLACSSPSVPLPAPQRSSPQTARGPRARGPTRRRPRELRCSRLDGGTSGIGGGLSRPMRSAAEPSALRGSLSRRKSGGSTDQKMSNGSGLATATSVFSALELRFAFRRLSSLVARHGADLRRAVHGVRGRLRQPPARTQANADCRRVRTPPAYAWRLRRTSNRHP
jgi:hypothetical protein